MKQEDLFKGAIVLARKNNYDKRSRCKVMVVGVEVATIQDKHGCKFVTRQSDLRPAKINRKALEELGFKEEKPTAHYIVQEHLQMESHIASNTNMQDQKILVSY